MNRCTLTPAAFASRISINDVPGFFSKQLQIEPGMRAVIIDDGRQLGEVPPGTYTLSSFSNRLHDWWNQKQCDVIMVRGEDQMFEITSAPVLTADFLSVQFRTRVAVQLRDVMIFHQKLMGSAPDYAREQLLEVLAPLLSQFIGSFVNGMTIDQLRAPDTWQRLDACLENNLQICLQLYGLSFSQVLTLSIVHPEYDAQLQRRGDTVLMEMAAETDRRRARVAEDATWEQVRQQDKARQVEAALEGLKIDRQQQELDQVLRRVQIRSGLREAVLSDKFNRLRTAADLADFVRRLDRDKLLAEDEHQQLQATLLQQSADRAAVRQQLLKRLALEQQFDLQLLADECNHRLALRRRHAELELASLNDTESDRQWRRKLASEAEQAEHDRAERWKTWQDQTRTFRSYWQEKREDEITDLLHQARRTQLLGDTEVDRQQREIRIQMMHDEQRLRSAQARAKEQEIDDEIRRNSRKRQQELELELQRATADLAHEQAERAARLQRDLAAGQLQEIQMRLAMQQESLRVMQENERLQQDAQHRRILEADKQRRKGEEWARQREHNRRMDELRLEKAAKDDERRDHQAHQLQLEQLRHDRFRDARGQSLEVLIFGADPEQARALQEVEAARHKAAADIEHARSAASHATALTQAQADTDRTQALLQELQRKEQELIAAKDKHIASLEAASDRRDASVQETLAKMVESLNTRNTPPGNPSVIINQGTQGNAAGTPQPGSFRTPGLDEKRCPCCHGIIALANRFCPLCGQKQ
ncbi:MAG: hypothetical protein ACKO2P_04440 [Planctomycetota bacterium]